MPYFFSTVCQNSLKIFLRILSDPPIKVKPAMNMIDCGWLVVSTWYGEECNIKMGGKEVCGHWWYSTHLSSSVSIFISIRSFSCSSVFHLLESTFQSLTENVLSLSSSKSLSLSAIFFCLSVQYLCMFIFLSIFIKSFKVVLSKAAAIAHQVSLASTSPSIDCCSSHVWYCK